MKKRLYVVLLALLIAAYLFLLYLVWRSDGFAHAVALFISNIIGNMAFRIYDLRRKKKNARNNERGGAN